MHNKSLVEKTGKSSLSKAVDVGINVKDHFDWDNHLEVLDKVLEEVDELKEAIQEKTKEDVFDEMGDVLFTLAQLARHLNFSPDNTLEFAIKKHELRHDKMLELIKNDKKVYTTMSLGELDPYWIKSKKMTALNVQSLLKNYFKL